MKQEARPGDGLESPGFSRGEEVNLLLNRAIAGLLSVVGGYFVLEQWGQGVLRWP